MADSPTPTSAPSPITAAIDAMAQSIQQEAQRRSEALMRVQALQTRLQDAKAQAAAIIKEIGDVQSAFLLETGPTAVGA